MSSLVDQRVLDELNRLANQDQDLRSGDYRHGSGDSVMHDTMKHLAKTNKYTFEHVRRAVQAADREYRKASR